MQRRDPIEGCLGTEVTLNDTVEGRVAEELWYFWMDQEWLWSCPCYTLGD